MASGKRGRGGRHQFPMLRGRKGPKKRSLGLGNTTDRELLTPNGDENTQLPLIELLHVDILNE